jgi:hypothetical protein
VTICVPNGRFTDTEIFDYGIGQQDLSVAEAAIENVIQMSKEATLQYRKPAHSFRATGKVSRQNIFSLKTALSSLTGYHNRFM